MLRRKSPARLTSRQFMQAVPAAVRAKLPPLLRDFRWRARGYLVQLYYGDPAVHYEVWSIRRIGRLEIGLHFESRDGALNERLRQRFDEHILDIAAHWGLCNWNAGIAAGLAFSSRALWRPSLPNGRRRSPGGYSSSCASHGRSTSASCTTNRTSRACVQQARNEDRFR